MARTRPPATTSPTSAPPIEGTPRVAATREALLPDDELQGLTELFRLLGDVTRVRLLYALVEAGELCVGDLSAATHTPETNVSHALRLLRTAGVVKARREGRQIHYSLDDAHVRMLLDLSREHLRHVHPDEHVRPDEKEA